MQEFLFNSEHLFSRDRDSKYLVSIVVRTKDRPRFLKRALNSILSQTVSNWQVIIVNDAGISIENVIEEVFHSPNLREKVVLLNRSVSSGMEAASNAGLKYVDGEYVCFLDDDDTWSSEFLRQATDYLNNNLNYAGVAVHTTVIQEHYRHEKFYEVSRYVHTPNLRAISFKDLLSINAFFVNAFIYRRSVLQEVGLYNELLPVVGDWEFNIRVLLRWDIGVLPIPLANYHQRIGDHDPQSGNTIIRDQDRHKTYDAKIRNQMFRQTLNKYPDLLGLMLVNQHSFYQVSDQLRVLQDEVTSIRKRQEFFIKPLLWIRKKLKQLKIVER